MQGPFVHACTPDWGGAAPGEALTEGTSLKGTCESGSPQQLGEGRSAVDSQSSAAVRPFPLTGAETQAQRGGGLGWAPCHVQ